MSHRVIAAGTLILAACGDDDDDSAESVAGGTAAVATSPAAETAAPAAVELWRNAPHAAAACSQLAMILFLELDDAVGRVGHHRVDGMLRQLGEPLNGVRQDTGRPLGKVLAALLAMLAHSLP